MAMPVPTHVI